MSLSDYDPIIERYGPPTDAQIVSQAEAERYRGRLPDGLLAFWTTYGRGWWHPPGKFALCDPAVFEPVLETAFRGDPEFRAEDFVVWAHNSFGDLNLSDRSDDNVTLDPQFMLFAKDAFLNFRTKDHAFARAMLYTIEAAKPWSDEDGTDMHPPALAKLGPLAPGEIYGHVPAIALGGDNEFDNLQKVRAREYLGLLVQSQPLELFDYGFDSPTGSRTVRSIGPQG